MILHSIISSKPEALLEMSSTACNIPTNPKRNSSAANLDDNESIVSSRIFDLPSQIFQVIFGGYLLIHEIVRFDRAVCNHVDRNHYLTLLSGMVLTNFRYSTETCAYIDSPLKLAWIYKRELRLIKISFGKNITGDDLCVRYLLYWPLIKELHLGSGPSVTTEVEAKSLVECLTKCISLEVLEFDEQDGTFSDGSFVDAMLTMFERPDFCARLKKIMVMESPLFLNDKTVTAISKHCHNLVEFEFQQCDNNDQTVIAPKVMADFLLKCGANLEKLDFENLHGFSDDDYLRVISYCPRLSTIKLNILSDTVLAEIARCYPDLVDLTLSCVHHEDDDDGSGLVTLFEGCRQLRKLEIANAELSSRSITRAFECCRNLRSVVLYYLPMTAEMLGSLAVNCPHTHLEELVFVGLGVFAYDLLELSSRCNYPNLQKFHCVAGLGGALEISDEFLLEFTKRSPSLRKIHISGGEHVTDTGMQHIARYCRNLEEVYISDARISNVDSLIAIVVNNPKIRRSNFFFASSHSKLTAGNVSKLRAILNSRLY
jgi:hypothetical protein